MAGVKRTPVREPHPGRRTSAGCSLSRGPSGAAVGGHGGEEVSGASWRWARAHAQAVVAQLPLSGTVRIAIDWTTEERQHLLMASLIVGHRAVPYAKRLLGFATARIADVQAWARMFALVAAALLLLTQLETHLLRHPQRQTWLRHVRSRRRARSEPSVIAVVCHLLDQVTALWNQLSPHTKLNLEAAL